jgi:maleate isomerase
MAQQYRSKGSIGLIVPPRCNETMLEEAFRIRPEGLTWCVAGLGLPELTERDFEVALRATESAARELAARKVSVIVQGGLLLHVAQGPSFHRELQQRLQAAVGDRIPVVTDRELIIAALQALGARRVSVITPYRQQIRDNLVRSLETHDVAVVSARGADLQLAEFITGLDFDSSYASALASFAEQPDTDAFYLACPQWPVVGNVARIEAATGKPVITQLTVILWWALQVLRLPDRVRGYGRLLEEMPAASLPEAAAR